MAGEVEALERTISAAEDRLARVVDASTHGA